MRDLSTNTRRLEWVLGFATMDLGGMRPGDWMNLREDLDRFVSLGIEGASGEWLAWPDPPAVNIPEIVPALQAEAREILEWVLKPQVRLGDSVPAAAAVPTSVSWTVGRDPDGTRTYLLARGEIRDLFVLRLVFSLAQDNLSRVQRCPGPECGRLFWKVGRKKYCGSRCMNRAVFKAWRKTKKGQTRSKREAAAAIERRKHYKRHPKALARLRTARAGKGATR